MSTATLKSDIVLDISLLVEGEEMNSYDITPALDDARDFLREGKLAVTDDDTHVKALEIAITPVAPIAAKVVDGGGSVGKQLQLYFSGTLPPANGGAGTDTSGINGIPKLTAGVPSAATAETDYVTPSGAGAFQNKTLDNTNNLALAALDKTNGAGASPGDVPTWDGSKYSPAPPGGGGATPVDHTITAGEDLALRDYVYLDPDDNKFYKVDIDADPPGVSVTRGFVIEAGGIATNATGQMRTIGEVTGFSGLTPWAPVFASTTPGSYTQVKPNVSAGGGQKAIVQAGYATSATKVMALSHYAVRYLKRENLAIGASLSIRHHADPQGRGRQSDAYVSSTGVGASLAAYASSNQDTDVGLRRLVYSADQCTGGTASASTTTAPYVASEAFDDDTADYGWIATTNTGTLQYDRGVGNAIVARRYTLFCFNSTEQPRMPRDWTFEGSNNGSSWTTLDTRSSITGWGVGETKTFDFSNTTSYRYYRLNITANNGDAFVAVDEMTIHTLANSDKDKLAQSFQIAGADDMNKVRLYLKKGGTPTGTMTVRIETDSAGAPSGTLADAAATVTGTESSLTTSYGYIDFDFASTFSLSGSTTYWVVLSSDRSASETNYVLWGADGSSPGYTDGSMSSQSASVWSTESKDAIFDVIAPGTAFDEGCSVGRWTGSGIDIGRRFDDGDGNNGDIYTSFINLSDTPLDVTCVVVIRND